MTLKYQPFITLGLPITVLTVKYAANNKMISRRRFIKSVSDIFTLCADLTLKTTDILK